MKFELSINEIPFDELTFLSKYERITEYYRRFDAGKRMVSEQEELFEYKLNN